MLKSSVRSVCLNLTMALAVGTTTASAVGLPQNGGPPLIRMDANNRVPACVTPDRLMQFMRSRNANLDPRFRDIASVYKKHGDAWRVRWDYAFYQMLIETNFLTYRAPNGRMGDVDPRQNNFAGIGTTGGGVPGDRFPDVSTGVLGQIQHLVAYSGERLAQPTAPRTQLKQDEIVAKSNALNRPVTFADLAGRWAVDKQYGKSIEWVAKSFRDTHCR
jgi:Mannosyl-glycoprotein endo-beta-N-acetylglucosaminidase